MAPGRDALRRWRPRRLGRRRRGGRESWSSARAAPEVACVACALVLTIGLDAATCLLAPSRSFGLEAPTLRTDLSGRSRTRLHSAAAALSSLPVPELDPEPPASADAAIPLDDAEAATTKIGPAEVQKYEVLCQDDGGRSRGKVLQRYTVSSPQQVLLLGVIGRSSYAKALRRKLIEQRQDRRNVLLFGEPGTNKQMFAFLIHFGSLNVQRQGGVAVGPLLNIQCQQLSSNAQRLFGSRSVPGLLDSADIGDLVLNNVHALNRQLQSDIARLIENGTYISRFDGQEKRSRLRVLAVAERKVEELGSIPGEKLRTIKVPPLRVRRQDIRALVAFELRRVCQKQGIPVPEVTEEAFRRLEAYDFPGNVKELFVFVSRALLELPPGGTITSDLFWPAQSVKKLDMFKVNLLDLYPGFRTFLQSDFFPEVLNHGFTKYVYAAFVILLFVGPQTRDANFGLNLFWAWWWPGILLTYPIFGRLWCSVCPFMIYGEVVQRWRLAQGAVLSKWPISNLEQYGGWFLFLLFLGILLWEELWRLENTAYLSSWLLLLITFGAMVCSWFFERRMWCRHLCPIGGMNGLYAKLALVELRAKNGQCNAECNTFHCYKGGPAEGEGQETGGCPLYSHPANLKDNRDCVLCMTCLKACPHRSVQLNLRAPGVDFGFPFLFPVPGTASASEHTASYHEVALMFLLLGAVVCHRIPELLQQLGWSRIEVDAALADFGTHSIIAFGTLAAPGLAIFAVDSAMRVAASLFAPGDLPARQFVELAYSYLPLVWLGSLAHYLLLGLTEAGRVLPVAAKTLEYFVVGAGFQPGDSFRFLERALPAVVASPDVVAFLQGVTLLAGGGLSSLMLQKFGGRAPFGWFHQAMICVITFELWQLIV